MAKEREAKPGARVLPEFIKLTRVGQSVAGKIVKFDKNENGDFFTLAPVFVREKLGGVWLRYDAAAFGITADIARKIDDDPTLEVNRWLVFYFKDTEATTRGTKKKLFKVSELEPAEVKALLARAIDKTQERADIIARSRGSVVPTFFPE